MDLARSIQAVTEEIVLRGWPVTPMPSPARTGPVSPVGWPSTAWPTPVCAGRDPFTDIWVQPAAGDAGGAVGAALYGWHQIADNPRNEPRSGGPHGWELPRAGVLGVTRSPSGSTPKALPYGRVQPAERARRIAELVADGNVVGLFQGRMEFGPRALGHRSIIGDPRDPEIQSRMNLKIKYRESFRPFAPAVLAEHASSWFDVDARLAVHAVHGAGRRHAPTRSGTAPRRSAGVGRTGQI